MPSSQLPSAPQTSSSLQTAPEAGTPSSDLTPTTTSRLPNASPSQNFRHRKASHSLSGEPPQPSCEPFQATASDPRHAFAAALSPNAEDPPRVSDESPSQAFQRCFSWSQQAADQALPEPQSAAPSSLLPMLLPQPPSDWSA